MILWDGVKALSGGRKVLIGNKRFMNRNNVPLGELEERSDELIGLLEEYYTLIQHDYYMARDRIRRINTSDIESLDFDEDLIVAFINMVKAFKPVAENIEIILLPKNTDWISHPPEVLERQRQLLKRIERETGVVVRNYQQIDAVSNDMFSDTTHLNGLDGLTAFTRFLAEEYAHLLVPAY